MADIARSAGAFGLFRIMLAAHRATGLEPWLRGDTPITALFVPDDALAPGTADALRNADAALLEAWAGFLRLHLLPGRWSASALAGYGAVASLNGRSLSVNQTGRLAIAGVAVIQADLRCDNGVLHVLEAPIAPPPARETALAP